jgi:hypothetical protein
MNGEIITIYLPIFEEKLAKLEARGQGNTDEAARLRRVTRWTNSDQPTAAETEAQAAA